MTYPRDMRSNRIEELPAMRLYVIGAAYLVLGGTHRLSVSCCQGVESGKE